MSRSRWVCRSIGCRRSYHLYDVGLAQACFIYQTDEIMACGGNDSTVAELQVGQL